MWKSKGFWREQKIQRVYSIYYCLSQKHNGLKQPFFLLMVCDSGIWGWLDWMILASVSHVAAVRCWLRLQAAKHSTGRDAQDVSARGGLMRLDACWELSWGSQPWTTTCVFSRMAVSGWLDFLPVASHWWCVSREPGRSCTALTLNVMQHLMQHFVGFKSYIANQDSRAGKIDLTFW